MDWTTIWEAMAPFLRAAAEKSLTVFLLIIGAIAVRLLLQLAIRAVVDRIVSGVKRKHRVDDTVELTSASPVNVMRRVQRTRSLGSVLSNSVTIAVVLVTSILLFAIIVPDATGAFALITAATGAGLGFGAQNIVKDVLNGIFIVSEDQLGIGDVVDLGLASGVVESVGIRVTQVRDANGTLWFVRNGEIMRLGNLSHGWSRAITDLAIPYDQDVDAVQDAILATAVAMAKEPKWRSRILERPELWGIESISSDAIVVRLVVKTRPSTTDDVAAELRKRIKATCDQLGIHLPSLTSIRLSGLEGPSGLRSRRTTRGRSIDTGPVRTASASAAARPVAAKPSRTPAEGEPQATTPAPTKPIPTAGLGDSDPRIDPGSGDPR